MKVLDADAGRAHAESLIRNYSRYIFYKIGKFRYLKYGLERDDLLQDIYIKVWKYCKKNDKDIPFSRHYIDTIINSVLINSIKKSKNEIKALDLLKRDNEQNLVSENACQQDMLNKTIIDSLNEIKAPSKAVIRLHLIGLTFLEIAELKNWGKSKTKDLYYRGIDELKKRLKEKGIDYED